MEWQQAFQIRGRIDVGKVNDFQVGKKGNFRGEESVQIQVMTEVEDSQLARIRAGVPLPLPETLFGTISPPPDPESQVKIRIYMMLRPERAIEREKDAGQGEALLLLPWLYGFPQIHVCADKVVSL